MSNYKTEVERTEALQTYFNQNIINIFNELAKDDSIAKSNKISQIVDRIQDIKSARKRWASGKLSGELRGTVMNFRCTATLPVLSFKPSSIYLYVDDVKQIVHRPVKEVLAGQTIFLDEKYVNGFKITNISSEKIEATRARIDKTSYSGRTVQLFYVQLPYNNWDTQTGYCKFNWIAFE